MNSTLFPGLASANPLIQLSVGAVVVFGGLYVLDSFGVPGMFGVALLVGIGVLLAKQADGTASAGRWDQGQPPVINVRKVV